MRVSRDILLAVIVLGMIVGIGFITPAFVQPRSLVGLFNDSAILIMVVLGTLGTTILFESLSHLIGRPRPPTQIWIILHIPGLPSGHSMASVVLFGFLAYLLVPKIHSAVGKGLAMGVTILIILFVGFTRVFTAAHYLTDVLAGYAIGIAWSGMVYTLIEMYFQKRRSLHTQKI